MNITMLENFRPSGWLLGTWLTALVCVQTVQADVNWDGDNAAGNFSYAEKLEGSEGMVLLYQLLA
ncbi:MAG: hypothetical protein EB101_11505 [Chitinophagia bacterium]|nr:hypothetical protein [Chitinophagia bacterium]